MPAIWPCTRRASEGVAATVQLAGGAWEPQAMGQVLVADVGGASATPPAAGQRRSRPCRGRIPSAPRSARWRMMRRYRSRDASLTMPRYSSSPRRLRRDEQRQQTRAQLLDAAERVFAREGYQGASIAAIAAEAGYSHGAVYSNFNGKEDLFLVLVEERIDARLAASTRPPTTR